MYAYISDLMTQASYNPDVKVVIITGNGRFFTTGNDLMNAMAIEGFEDVNSIMKFGLETYTTNFIESFILCKKPVIAAINGPAVGIGATILGCCDFVYAAEKATFSTPFMTLAIGVEACASITFPKIMGKLKSNEILMLGKVFTSKEAKECGFVNDVLPDTEALMKKVNEVAKVLAEYDQEAIIHCKRFLHGVDIPALLQRNKEELANLIERFSQPAAMEAVQKFMSRRAKL